MKARQPITKNKLGTIIDHNGYRITREHENREFDELSTHNARKTHKCTPYFLRKCKGNGYINKGETYFSPTQDCIDPFHPYRICQTCREEALKWDNDMIRAAIAEVEGRE